MPATYGHHGDKLPEKRSGRKRKTESGLKTKPEHARRVRSRSATPALQKAAGRVKTHRTTKHRKGKRSSELSLRRERGRARSMGPGREGLSGSRPGILKRRSTGTKTVTLSATEEQQEKQSMASLHARFVKELTREPSPPTAEPVQPPSGEGPLRPTSERSERPPQLTAQQAQKAYGKQGKLRAPLVQKPPARPEPEASPERQPLDLSTLKPISAEQAAKFKRGNVEREEARRARYREKRSRSPDETPEVKRARLARYAAKPMPDERARQKAVQEEKTAAQGARFKEQKAKMEALGTTRAALQGEVRATEQVEKKQWEKYPKGQFTTTKQRRPLSELESEVPTQPMPAPAKKKEVTFREQASPTLGSAARFAALEKSAEPVADAPPTKPHHNRLRPSAGKRTSG